MQPMQIVVEVLNAIDAHNLSKVERRFAESLVVQDNSLPATLNKPAYLDQMQAILKAFADWKYDLDSIEADGEQVTVHVTGMGSAAGKQVKIPAQLSYTVINDEIHELKVDGQNGGTAAVLAQIKS